MTPQPDLLYPDAREEVPPGDVVDALTFAFTTGCRPDAFDRVRGAPEGTDATFDAESFADQLFLTELVDRCLTVPRELSRHGERPGRTRAVVAALCRPPGTPDGVRFRQGITRELSERREVRAAAVRAYACIGEFRALLEAAALGQERDPLRRRIEILYALRAAIDTIAGSFVDATSGLARASAWARAVKESPPFVELSRLLEHEAHLADVDVSVRLGRDGEVRSYQIVRVGDVPDNPFRVSPLTRFLARLRLMILGHRVRPAEVGSRLVDGVFEALHPVAARLFGLQRDLDVYLGSLSFRELAERHGLAVCLPDLAAPGDPAPRRVRGLYNPYLLLEEHAPVPCDVSIDAPDALVVVTGPNSGGKTRFVESMALLQLLAHAGLWAPAAEARLPWANGLYASLHIEPTLLHREGSLGTELLRVRELFERIDAGGMVVVDELCSGTNPSEGEEIFELVMSLLAELRVQAFVTTHFLRFAGRLREERPVPRLAFLQVGLDEREHPTYQFTEGVAQTSLARKTAERLGVTREELGAIIGRKLRRAGS